MRLQNEYGRAETPFMSILVCFAKYVIWIRRIAKMPDECNAMIHVTCVGVVCRIRYRGKTASNVHATNTTSNYVLFVLLLLLLTVFGCIRENPPC